MRSKITLQQETVTADTVGNRMNTWVDRYTCRAYVNMQAAGEHEGAGRTVETETLIFTIRYCQAVSGLSSGAWRVLFNGRTYDITSVDDYRLRHETLKLTASRTER